LQAVEFTFPPVTSRPTFATTKPPYIGDVGARLDGKSQKSSRHILKLKFVRRTPRRNDRLAADFATVNARVSPVNGPAVILFRSDN